MRRAWLAVGVFVLLFPASGNAASAFADPSFQQQWQAGEAVTPNFWGPLATARNGQSEPYVEAVGGERLVQYFDKGRMELTNGKVTNGLLASEIIQGKIQLGDVVYDSFPALPKIPIAGDPDNPGPTYEALGSKAKALLAATPTKVGNSVTTSVSAIGDISDGAAGAGQSTITAYDDVTKHNILGVFADYRNTTGLASIGLAISEPFRASVKVAGTQRDVIIQAFERRVLTYTPSNPAAFQVEMGNIGLHYYMWRYVNPAGTTITISPGSAAAAQSSGALKVNLLAITDTVVRGRGASVGVTTTPDAMCSIQVTYPSGPETDIPLAGPRQAEKGAIIWIWRVKGNVAPGTANVVVNCALGGTIGGVTTSFTITP